MTTPLQPLGQFTLTAIPGDFVYVRDLPSTSGRAVGRLHKGDLATLYSPDVEGWVHVAAAGVEGWISRQNGNVVFTAVDAPLPAFRLKNPVGCAHIISSHFGVQRDYDGDGIFDDIHEGLDITRAHPDCTPLIRAAAAGVVEDVSSVGDYGNHVKVRTTHGAQVYVLWYCHLERVFVVKNAALAAGDPIGIMGTTGNSTGLHLHLNVQKLGAPTPKGSPVASVIDPEPLIDW